MQWSCHEEFWREKEVQYLDVIKNRKESDGYETRYILAIVLPLIVVLVFIALAIKNFIQISKGSG
jgi:hypothetical protein